jgi:hypothetical protein
MREFTDDQRDAWVATATEEDTPRHHGRWYLVFHPAAGDTPLLASPEVRWQSLASAERTIATMSLFELRRRLAGAERRAGEALPGGPATAPWVDRTIDLA